jgi:hypothetical protein
VLDPWQVVALAAAAALVIALWVRREYGPRPALVMTLLAAAALVSLWLAYLVVPIEEWRRDSLPVGLAIFAIPAATALALALIVTRRHSGRIGPSGFAYIAVLWATPAILLYVSQRTPFGNELANLLWWAASTIFIYICAPVAYARLTGQSIRSYGLSLTFITRETVVVALIVPVALALVWLVSSDERFIETYPFFSGDGWALFGFELAYGATFVALEFFFRGFLVFAGERVIGIHAVPVMAFSYCLLHLGKPMPEAVSSLIGGLILGYVALRLRSILAGVVAHLTMAWGMDAAVLRRS